MAPKQHRDRAVPKAKRSRAGNTRRLRDSDADTMRKCQQCHSRLSANVAAYSKICKECWKIRNSQRRGYCYVLEFEGGVYRIGHTVNLDNAVQAYASATKVAWYAKAPVDVCRRISQRILSETSSARTPRACIPWGHATYPQRKRRGRIAFFGESKLRSEIYPGEIHQVCARCAVIFCAIVLVVHDFGS